MCDPVSISTLALGVGSAVTGYIGQRNAAQDAQRQADQQKANDDAYYVQNKQSATDAATLASRDIGLRQSEDILASATQQHDTSQQTQSAVSSARTSAAEAGLTGHSLDAVVNNIQMQGSTELGRIQTNEGLAVSQLDREKQAVLNDAQSRINSVRPGTQVTVRGPSLLTPILGSAGAAVNAYDYHYKRTAGGTPGQSSDTNAYKSLMPEADNG